MHVGACRVGNCSLASKREVELRARTTAAIADRLLAHFARTALNTVAIYIKYAMTVQTFKYREGDQIALIW